MQEIRVRVLQHRSTGLLVAISDDLPGLSIAAKTIEEIESELAPVVRGLLEAQGERVGTLTVSPPQPYGASGFVADPSFTICRQAA